jgi:hypothetical protein
VLGIIQKLVLLSVYLAEYIFIGFAILDPAFLAAVGTAGAIGLITYIVVTALE